MWIEKPELPRKCKVLIFKSAYEPFPWVLSLPSSDGVGSGHAVKYPDWQTPWMVAGAIQDKINRNESF